MIRRIRGAASRLCLFMLAAATALAVPRQVSVTAVSSPIMDAASSDAQELGRVQKGTRLTASGRTSGDWLEVQAPASISGWVYGELVRDAVIAASSVKVRSGPGIGYEALGTLTRGDAVVVRGRRGDWIEVEGQPSFLVWIERAMVAEGASVDLTVAAKPPVAPVSSARVAAEAAPSAVESEPSATLARVPVAVPVPAVSASPAETPAASPPVAPRQPDSAAVPAPSPPVVVAPPAIDRRRVDPPVSSPSRCDRSASRAVSRRPALATAGFQSPVGVRLLQSAPQGEPVVVSGVLRPVGVALFQPAPYRLVTASGAGPARTLCYVASQSPLPPMGTAIRLQGLKYWVYGSREPVVLVREISEYPGLTGVQ